HRPPDAGGGGRALGGRAGARDRGDRTGRAHPAPGMKLGLARLGRPDVVRAAREAIVEGTPDAVLVVDGRQRIVHANPAAERLLGSPAGLLADRPLERALARHGELLRLLERAAEGKREVTLAVGAESRAFEVRVS